MVLDQAGERRRPNERDVKGIIPNVGNGLRGYIKNGHKSSSTIDLPGLGYSADIYMGGAYREKELELVGKLKLIIAEAKVWTPDVAERMVEDARATCNPDNASMICFRKSTDPTEIESYRGLTWQEIEDIPTSRGSHRTVWMKFRVLDPESQGLHLGRWAMQEAISLYLELGVDSISHKSGSKRAVHAFNESNAFKNGCRYPKDRGFDQEAQMAQVLLWLWDRHQIHGEMPSLTSGVSINDYEEPNGADPINDEKYPNIKPTRGWLESIGWTPTHTIYEVYARGK